MKLVAPECTRCGAKLPLTAAPSVVTCTYCGAEHAREQDDPSVRAGVTSATRSDDTRAPVKVTFVNERAGALDLHWLDFAGAAQPYGRVAPGTSRLFDSYVGHVWSVRDAATGAEVLRWAAPDPTTRRVPVR